MDSKILPVQDIGLTNIPSQKIVIFLISRSQRKQNKITGCKSFSGNFINKRSNFFGVPK